MNLDNAGQPLPEAPLSTSFVDGLHEPFLSIARECIPLQGLSLLSSPAERADQLQIQLRSQLLALVHESLTDTDTTAADDGQDNNEALQDVGIFWKGSLELCLHLVYFCDTSGDAMKQDNQDKDARYKGMNVRKLPLLLLEDALDSLPLEYFQRIWASVVEPSFPILFSKIMWHHPTNTGNSAPCALPFIKLCNKFLRTLSASVVSPSSRTQKQQPTGTESRIADDDWSGRILLTLAAAFPLSDKSATKVWGSFSENVTNFESKAAFEQQKLEHGDLIFMEVEDNVTTQNVTTTQEQHSSNSSFSFYETLWSVQNDFSNPTNIKVADFLERMNVILATLESQPLSSSTVAAANSHDTMEHQQSPAKYLTSSHLLPIQLGDSEFRIHFLTQFLIVEHHLSSESPALGNAMATIAKRSIALLKSISSFHAMNGSKEQINIMDEGGAGPVHWEILEFILRYREIYWREWKKSKCHFDMEWALSRAGEDNGSELVGNNEKRKRLLDGSLGTQQSATRSKKMKMDEEELLIDFVLHEKENLKATCALQNDVGTLNSRSVAMPSPETHLESYVDALDPDSGIEADYHPKKDSLFTWQALRLLSRDYLGKFHMINHKGDFEKMVRTIYKEEKGIKIPGETPHEEAPVDAMDADEARDAEDDEKKNHHITNETSQDQDQSSEVQSQSQSGSPLEDAQMTDGDGDTADVSEKDELDGAKAENVQSSINKSGIGDDSESDEPRRVKSEIFDSDEGEIEESKAGKSSEVSSPEAVARKQPVKDEISSESNQQAIPVPSHIYEGSRNDNSKNISGESNTRRAGNSNRAPKERNESENWHQENPSTPLQRGSSRGGRDRDTANAPLASYNRFAESRDHVHNVSRQQRGGNGEDDSSGRRSGSRNRDSGVPRGGESNGRHEEISGGGRRNDRQGGDNRYDDRRGNGDRRNDRRGGGSERRGGSRRGGRR